MLRWLLVNNYGVRIFIYFFITYFQRKYDDANRVLYSVPKLKIQENRTDTLVSWGSELTFLETVAGPDYIVV